MRSNRGRDTSPEMAVRRAVWARGMRYRVDTRPLPELNRRADLVFRQERVAVFVELGHLRETQNALKPA